MLATSIETSSVKFPDDWAPGLPVSKTVASGTSTPDGPDSPPLAAALPADEEEGVEMPALPADAADADVDPEPLEPDDPTKLVRGEPDAPVSTTMT